MVCVDVYVRVVVGGKICRPRASLLVGFRGRGSFRVGCRGRGSFLVLAEGLNGGEVPKPTPRGGLFVGCGWDGGGSENRGWGVRGGLVLEGSDAWTWTCSLWGWWWWWCRGGGGGGGSMLVEAALVTGQVWTKMPPRKINQE